MVFLKKYFLQNHYDVLDLRTVFKPLYIVLSILGLFPYSVHLKSNSNGFTVIPRSIYLNLMCAFANIFIICSFLVLHMRYIYFSIEESILTEGIMTQMNYITELFTLQIFCMITYLIIFRNGLKCVSLLNKLSAIIDEHIIGSETVLHRLRLQVNFMIWSLIFLLVIQLVVNFTRSDSIYKMFLVVFSFILPQMIQFTMIGFFYILIRMVVEIFKSIVEHIESTTSRKSTDGFTKVSSKRTNLTLRQIEIIYVEVFEVTQWVNRLFEMPILVTLMQCFHSIVSEAHIIYHVVLIQKDLDAHVIANCSIWIIYQILKVYVISSAGKFFQLEAINLSRAIYTIPSEKRDLQFYIEVQRLSTLMALPGNELTIYGYFSIDATLMFKVMASAAMYLIILVQFDKKS